MTGSPRSGHSIEAIRYVGTDPGDDGEYAEAPLDCACGWSGRLGDFTEHKRLSPKRPINYGPRLSITGLGRSR